MLAQSLGIPNMVGAMLAATLLAAGCGIFNVNDTYEGRTRAFHWSLAASAHAFSVLILGVVPAIVGAAAGAVVVELGRRASRRTVLSNTMRAGVATGAGAAAFVGAGGAAAQLALPDAFVPIGAMVIAYSLAYSIVSAAANVTGGAGRRRQGVLDELDELPVETLGLMLECTLGVVVAATWVIEPWLVPLLGALALSRYLAVTRGSRLLTLSHQAFETFANIVDERDPYTAQHSTRVCAYAMTIGYAMGLSARELERLYWTARLHDLGKVAVDNAILNKPGKLTDLEFEVIKQHPVVSARLLRSFTFTELEADIVRCHHERFDGRGYLNRPQDAVPREAFIIAVADSFDAMTSVRPYRGAMPEEVALLEVYNNIGSQFHPEAAMAFLNVMGFDWSSVAAVDSPAALRSPDHAIDIGDDLGRSAA